MSQKSRGFLFALLAIVIFAAQDGLTKYLGDRYPPILITMIRFWAFAVFVTGLASTSQGGLRQRVRTHHLLLQVIRGLLLVGEIVVIVFSYKLAGLAMSQAIFQATPLIITVLSIPLLGEKVGWRRGTAVAAGFIGVLIIINPVNVSFTPALLLPLLASLMFASYSIATRAVGGRDSAQTSLFYAGVVGCIAITAIGPFYWTDVAPGDWPILGLLCICGTLSHYFLIRAYALLPANEIQPVTYLQLVLNVIIAATFFGESVTLQLVIGAMIVVAAGLFTVWREHRVARSEAKAL